MLVGPLSLSHSKIWTYVPDLPDRRACQIISSHTFIARPPRERQELTIQDCTPAPTTRKTRRDEARPSPDVNTKYQGVTHGSFPTSKRAADVGLVIPVEVELMDRHVSLFGRVDPGGRRKTGRSYISHRISASITGHQPRGVGIACRQLLGQLFRIHLNMSLRQDAVQVIIYYRP
ncbi:hypothetical protein CONLIGDRAFT_296467 [Coniochaeta ligniaria NRRL 30616]|uniref:Uncharacterized protein n=1 Tax=Coniochaeta ligniaria NRRL 30616 TaxID=1408157 RepID=A0A1J7IUZ4_9PEZI|nr:hypothetical protein CONLIGDRAFT_296467 [Coniochaeta ligniaria NRRL 30616]